MQSSTNNISSETHAETGIEPIPAGLSILFLSILTIAGNILFLSTLRKLRKRNRNSLHSLHTTLQIFSCLELAFAAIPELLISAAFLSKTWSLDSVGRGWCNFTGWFAFTTKTTCAFITTIVILERYAEVCKQTSSPSRFHKIMQNQLYWALRSLLLSGLMATVPLFYDNGSGIVSTEKSGSYCHVNFGSNSSAGFVYSIILCTCGYGLLQVVLFSAISILCQWNNQKCEEDTGSNPVQVTTNHQYYTTPPASPTSNLRSESPLSPSKYALDYPTYFETMQNDVKIQKFHLTRTILILTFWYWICLLPYLVSMYGILILLLAKCMKAQNFVYTVKIFES